MYDPVYIRNENPLSADAPGRPDVRIKFLG